MRISIFGLGYVGCVTAACLARDGHDVVGVDVNPVKVAGIAAGKSPIIERGLEDLLKTVVRQGKLRATIDARDAVLDSDISLICVGTPSNPNGSLNTRYVESVCKEIGLAIPKNPGGALSYEGLLELALDSYYDRNTHLSRPRPNRRRAA